METAIICVDDEKSILSGLEQQIHREFNSQFIVEFAQSGEEALGIINDLIENNIAIPLVITDQMMPGLKGTELINILSEKLPETKCIMLSGYTNSEELKGHIYTNLISCLAKPWNHEELMNLIRQNALN